MCMAAAMERLQILVTPEQRRRLIMLARAGWDSSDIAHSRSH